MTRFFLVTIVGILLTVASGSAQIKILTPAAGDTLQYNKIFNITWTGSLPKDTLLLQYSINGGKNYRTISERVTDTIYRWKVPHDYTDSAVLRLVRARSPHVVVMGTPSPTPVRTPMALHRSDGLVATSASLSGPRRSTIWNPLSGGVLLSLDTLDGVIHSFAFSPTGDTLAVGFVPSDRRDTAGPRILFYDLRTRALVKVIQREGGQTGDNIRTVRLAYSPLGDRIDAIGCDKSSHSYDIATGERVVLRYQYAGQVRALAYSHNGLYLAHGTDAGNVAIHLARSITPDLDRLLMTDIIRQRILGLAFSPDDSLLAISTSDSLVSIRNRVTGTPVLEFSPHHSAVLSVAFSPDGRLLLTTGVDRLARVWEWRTQALVGIFAGHRDSVTHGDFTADGKQIVTSSNDGTVRLWKINYQSEGDTSDVMFSIRHFRPTIPDTIARRFPFPGNNAKIYKFDTTSICNEGAYPIVVTAAQSIEAMREHRPYGIVTAFVGSLPKQIAPGACLTFTWTYVAPPVPMIDSGHYSFTISEDILTLYYRIETYLVADAGEEEAVAGTMELRATPNPVVVSTRLDFTLPGGGEADIVISNMRGNVVQTVELGFLPAGPRSSEVDLSDLPSGLYRATVRSAGDVISTTIAVVR